jgi:hypothetical protein
VWERGESSLAEHHPCLSGSQVSKDMEEHWSISGVMWGKLGQSLAQEGEGDRPLL